MRGNPFTSMMLERATMNQRRLALSDQQMTRVMDAARHLPPRQRGQFLQAVAEQLRGCDHPGDGDLHRVLRAVSTDMEDERLTWVSP
jgi:hypothetical protein